MKLKLNQKGFSLLELIAVITILVIILLVAIPSITSSLEKRKLTDLENKKKLLLQAAEIYIGNNREEIVPTGKSACYIIVNDMVDKNLITSEDNIDSDNNQIATYIKFTKNTGKTEIVTSVSGLSKCEID